jgi:hypothetical protein
LHWRSLRCPLPITHHTPTVAHTRCRALWTPTVIVGPKGAWLWRTDSTGTPCRCDTRPPRQCCCLSCLTCTRRQSLSGRCQSWCPSVTCCGGVSNSADSTASQIASDSSRGTNARSSGSRDIELQACPSSTVFRSWHGSPPEHDK